MDLSDLTKTHFVFTMPKEDFQKYCAYYEFFKRKLKERHSPPDWFLDDFIKHFTLVPEVPKMSDRDLTKMTHVIDATIERFSGEIKKREDYRFECKKRFEGFDIPDFIQDENGKLVFTDNISSKYYFKKSTFSDLIGQTVRTVFEKKNVEEHKSKEKWNRQKFIGEVYVGLWNYISNNTTKNIHKEWSHYKLAVIATYITIKAGFSYSGGLNEGDRHSAQELEKKSHRELEHVKKKNFN